MYNKNVSEKIIALSAQLEAAEDVDAFFAAVTGFYKDYGVGMFGLNKAFRIKEKDGGDVEFVAIEGLIGKFGNVPVHSPLFGEHIHEPLVIPLISLELHQQSLKQRQAAVPQIDADEFGFAYCRFLHRLLHHCGQLLVIADKYKLFYPASIVLLRTEESYQMRFENLR